MKYLLDTDICIFYFKGKYGLNQKVKSVAEHNCFVSEITVLELTFGAYNSKQFDKHIAEVEKLQGLFGVLPVRPIRHVYGQERKRLKDLGLLIPNFDLLIGVTAKYHDMVMVTRNTKHFSRIEELSIEDWTDVAVNSYAAGRR